MKSVIFYLGVVGVLLGGALLVKPGQTLHGALMAAALIVATLGLLFYICKKSD